MEVEVYRDLPKPPNYINIEFENSPEFYSESDVYCMSKDHSADYLASAAEIPISAAEIPFYDRYNMEYHHKVCDILHSFNFLFIS